MVIDFLRQGVLKELVLLPVVQWNMVCRTVEKGLDAGDGATPLLLRGVFLRMPLRAEWNSAAANINTARQQLLARRQHAKRKDYMREYMRQRRGAQRGASAA